MLASNSVQEAHDLALVAQAATLEARLPFMHFFDGFRTSHEVGKIYPISDETIRAMVDDKWIIQYRQNALSPDRPILRGTAQNPDVFFQAREACSPFYKAVPCIVQSVMDRFAAQTGRAYHLFDYFGAPGLGARIAQGSALSALRCIGIPRRAAHDRQVDRHSRPLQGAGRCRRASLPGHRHRARGEFRTAALRDAGRDRRPLWSLIEGIHAGHGERHLR
jgi:hypothetical protein